MKEVTKKEYLDSFKNLDAICNIDDSKGYPYSTYWTLRNSNNIIAKSEPVDKSGINYKYFIRL